MVTIDAAPGTPVILNTRVWHGMYHDAGTTAIVIGTTTTTLTGKREALDIMAGANRLTVWPHEIDPAA